MGGREVNYIKQVSGGIHRKRIINIDIYSPCSGTVCVINCINGMLVTEVIYLLGVAVPICAINRVYRKKPWALNGGYHVKAETHYAGPYSG
jgi:hypothetical protein